MRHSFLTCLVLVLAAGAPARSATMDDEEMLRNAGLTADGPALLTFFRTRAHTSADGERLDGLVQKLTGPARGERGQAVAELMAWGPLAIPVLRRVANDFDHTESAGQAQRCLRWLEGPASANLAAAAARVIGTRKPEGAAEALLAYLPFAEGPEVVREVTNALAAVALAQGKPDPALVRGLADSLPVRRAAACVALGRVGLAHKVPAVKKLLNDPSPNVRLRAALARARSRDVTAIPVLIDLLADLSVEQRRPAEEFLMELAGEWAPVIGVQGEDEISRRIRRDAWAAWWRNTEGPALMELIRRRTPTAADLERVRDLIGKLGSDTFAVRERASADLVAMGPLALPILRTSLKVADPEVARRAEACTRRIEQEPTHRLPLAALRLLALRQPEGAAEALLNYLPYAEDDSRANETRAVLGTLARVDGRPAPALVKALTDRESRRRAAAAEALARAGGDDIRPAVRKLLQDPEPLVRLQVAQALLAVRERDAVPVLIDLLTVLPAERSDEILGTLYLLAGDKAPALTIEKGVDEKTARKKHHDSWVAWWKSHGASVDLARLDPNQTWLGYTLLIGNGYVEEIDRDGRTRWSITGLQGPLDASVLPGNRVLIVEANGQRVSERDFSGKILWQKERIGDLPLTAQRMPGGNTFIATRSRLFEVDRNGKEVFSINNAGRIDAGYRARNGDVICLNDGGPCVRLTTTGKQLKSFPCGRVNQDAAGGLSVLPNGHVLICQQSQSKIVEYDTDGHVVHTWSAKATTASRMPNGHLLAADNDKAFELDRDGKVVWQSKSNHVFRARRR